MEKRLTLDQFKKKNVNLEKQEDLKKMTGGILGACHPQDTVKQVIKDHVEKIWDNIWH